LITNAYIRVDGSLTIGSGHLVRCLSIAQYLKTKNINVLFITRSKNIVKYILENGIEVKVLENDCSLTDELSIIQNLLSTSNPNLMVLDVNNYHTFKTIDDYSYYLKSLGKMHVFTVSFEDPKNHPPLSDLAILPYAGSDNLKYPDGKCLYLTGPKYFVLPRIFLNAKPAVIRKNPDRLLVSMGGSDPKNITLKVLRALNKTKINIQLTIIVGGFSKITDTMVNNEMDNYKGRFSIIRDCKNMAEVISQSDMAIIGSGLIKYETASLGLPSIVISLDQYHSSIMDDFVRYNCVEHLGHADIVKDSQIAEATINLMNDFKKRQRMSDSGKLMIDGCGVERIFSKVTSKVKKEMSDE
jgi:UDP-2,4-diacetamido-2,4,6-trideoxy-beta-L-altropyranose hydrolase